jgi:DNA polymerase-3 subunit gamma/tau
LDAKVGNRESDPPSFPSREVLPDIYAESAPSDSSILNPDHLQQAAVDALMSAKSQSTAADAIADSDFTLTGTDLTIQTTHSKTMLPTVINPDAEKILRAAIQSVAPGLKITLLPATATAKSTASKKPRAAASGSAQARAMEHPIVQEAQRLFNAEIRNVIDLTSND